MPVSVPKKVPPVPVTGFVKARLTSGYTDTDPVEAETLKNAQSVDMKVPPPSIVIPTRYVPAEYVVGVVNNVVVTCPEAGVTITEAAFTTIGT